MDTLPSGVLLNGGFRSALICFQLSLSGPFRLLHTVPSLRPARHYSAFGYAAPHPSVGGTSTLLSNALLSTQYGAVRLLLHVHVRRSVFGLRGPVLILRPRRTGDLPVLVHVVSQRAQVLRLRRTEQPLAITRLPCCLPPLRNGVGILIHRLFEAQ
jgi:hypothetical protein